MVFRLFKGAFGLQPSCQCKLGPALFVQHDAQIEERLPHIFEVALGIDVGQSAERADNSLR